MLTMLIREHPFAHAARRQLNAGGPDAPLVNDIATDMRLAGFDCDEQTVVDALVPTSTAVA